MIVARAKVSAAWTKRPAETDCDHPSAKTYHSLIQKQKYANHRKSREAITPIFCKA